MAFTLEFSRERFCPRNVAVLRTLVAAAEQNDDDIAASDEIDAITRSVIDAHLANAPADRSDVAEVAEREPANSQIDPTDGPSIAEFGNPLRID